MKKFTSNLKLFLILAAMVAGVSDAFATCELVNNASGSKQNIKSTGVVLYSAFFDAQSTGSVKYSTTGYGSGMSITLYYTTDNGSNWTKVGSVRGNQSNKTASISTSANGVKFVTTTEDGGRTHIISQNYQVSGVTIERASSLSSSTTDITFDELFVNGSASKMATITFSNTGTSISATSSKSEFTTSFDDTTIDCSGTRTLTINFCPTSEGNKSDTITVKAGSKTVTITVKGSAKAKATPTFDWNSAFSSTIYVGQTINPVLSSNSDATSPIKYTVSDFVPSGSNNEGVDTPYVDASVLHCSQAGTFTLTATQAAGTNYLEHSDSMSVTITKYANPVVVKFNDAIEAGNTLAMVYGTGVNVGITSANDANTLTISQTAGDDIATYYADQEAVYTSYKNGTATWTVSQPENYKYLAGSATFSVNVAPEVVSEYAINEVGDVTASALGELFWSCDLVGLATFEAYKTMATAIGDLRIDAYINGNWVEVKSISVGDLDKNSYKSFSVDLTGKHALGLRFVNEGSYSRYIRNVKVLNIIDFTTLPSDGGVLNMPACQLESSSEETITINYSRPRTSNNIHIECNNDHFVLSKSVIENVSCNSGSEDITVTFTPTGQDDEEGIITIYDESEIRTITVKGKTVSRVAPEIHWLMPAVVEFNRSFVGLNNIVTSSNTESPIVITSSDETIASYDADTKTIATYERSGKVTFTVHQDATDAFHEVDLQFSIIVSNESESLCLLASNDDKHALGAYAESSYTISFDAPADKITYNMWKESASISSITVTWYNEEGNKISSRDYPVSDMSTSAKQFEMSLPRNARSVKFSAEGSIFDRTVNKNVSYIRVYRANYLEHNAVLSDGKLNFGEAEYGAADATIEFDVEYSGSGEFYVESSDQEHFALSESISRTIDCENGYGTQHVSVAYHHTTVGVQNATLTVQLGTDVLSIPLTGSTKRPSEAVFIGAEGDDWNNPDNWLGGVLPAAGDEISVRGELVIDNGETRTVESLVIEPTGSVLVVGNGSLIVNGAGTTATGNYGDLRIDKDGEVQLNMTDAEPLHVNNFFIESAPTAVSQTAASGQLENAEKLQFANAYIDITLAPAGVFDASQWYGFAVPFPVSVSDGVFQFNELGEVSKATDGVDYMIYYYDGMKRYNTGKGWTRMTGTLNPGEFYYLTVNDGHNVMRFQKTADGGLVSADTKTITAYGDAAVKPADANWNAMGNPMLQHQNASGVEFVQIYVNGESRYTTVRTSDYSFVVGSPFFVQAASGTLGFSDASHTEFYAPGRVAAEESLFHAIELLNTSEKVCDRIYVAAGEKEAEGYVLGTDLQKAGVTTRVAQMWIDRYGLKLSVNKEEAIADETEFPVVFSAPAAGEYILRATDAAANYSLYLMHNGDLVWDLSASDYQIDLQKGNTAGYSIVMQHHMPGIATGMDAVSEKSGAEKVLVNGNLYIINQNAVYSAAGNRVK